MLFVLHKRKGQGKKGLNGRMYLGQGMDGRACLWNMAASHFACVGNRHGKLDGLAV
jgi:hypothetical protein